MIPIPSSTMPTLEVWRDERTDGGRRPGLCRVGKRANQGVDVMRGLARVCPRVPLPQAPNAGRGSCVGKTVITFPYGAEPAGDAVQLSCSINLQTRSGRVQLERCNRGGVAAK